MAFRGFCFNDLFGGLTDELFGKSYHDSLSLYLLDPDSLIVQEAPGGAIKLCESKTTLTSPFDDESLENQGCKLSELQPESIPPPSIIQQVLTETKVKKLELDSDDSSMVEREIRKWVTVPEDCFVPKCYYYERKMDPSLLTIKDKLWGTKSIKDLNAHAVLLKKVEEGTNTLFVDGAFRAGKGKFNGRGGVGGVLRDHRGKCLRYFSGQSYYVKDSSFHERESVLEGLKVAKEANLSGKLIVCLDNEDVKKEIEDGLRGFKSGNDSGPVSAEQCSRGEGNDSGPESAGKWSEVRRKRSMSRSMSRLKNAEDIIDEILLFVMLNWKLSSISFEVICREANYPSDYLSRLETKSGRCTVRKDGDPDFLIEFPFLEYLLKRDREGYYLKYDGNYEFMKSKRARLARLTGRAKVNEVKPWVLREVETSVMRVNGIWRPDSLLDLLNVNELVRASTGSIGRCAYGRGGLHSGSESYGGGGVGDYHGRGGGGDSDGSWGRPGGYAGYETSEFGGGYEYGYGGRAGYGGCAGGYGSSYDAGFTSGYRGSGGGRKCDDESRGPLQLTRTTTSLGPPSLMEGGALSEPASSSRPSPFGEARPKEEVLAERREAPPREEEIAEIGARQTTSQPTSSSSRPQSDVPRVVDVTDQRPLSQSARSDDARHMEPRG